MSQTIDPNDELLTAFIEESIHSIRELPVKMTEYNRDSGNEDAINSVFRTVHSIKGNAGFFGLSAIKKFAHTVENTLDDIRNKKLALSDDLNRAIIESFDQLELQLHAIEIEGIDGELPAEAVSLLERISQLSQAKGEGLSDDSVIAALSDLTQEMRDAGFPEAVRWAEQIQLAVGQDLSTTNQETRSDGPLLISPEDALSAKYELSGQDVSPFVHRVAELFNQPRDGKWSDSDAGDLLEALAEMSMIFRLRGDAAISKKAEKAVKDYKTLYESPIGIDNELMEIIWSEVSSSIDGFFKPDEEVVDPLLDVIAQVPAKGQQAASNTKKQRSIRVNEDHLDHFLDDVSNLFITCERLKDVQARMVSAESIRDLVEELRQINTTFSTQANDLQKSVVTLRKVPIRSLLSKFPPMARKLATDLGKSMDVFVEGEDVEVDKSLIEDLDAPLTHMIRNVADHALELPDQRVARGAEPTGNLFIKAETTRTHIVLTVRDDGKGIDPDRLRQKALEKQILSEIQINALSDQEAIDLIFHPGFSTAAEVTEISGRGVGMDVVRTTIRDYDGDVTVRSVVNEGTEFTIEIPIRQAVMVIDGLLVKAGGEQFIVPFENIREVFELESNEVSSCHDMPMTVVRGETYSVISMGEHLGLRFDCQWKTMDRMKAILVASKKSSVCVLVDGVIGKRKVVVNDISGMLDNCSQMAGVAQLGAGRLALVVSVPELLNTVTSGVTA